MVSFFFLENVGLAGRIMNENRVINILLYRTIKGV